MGITPTFGESLTFRECDIMNQVTSGKSTKEISQELNISRATVYKHLERIYIKYGVHNKIQALLKYNIERDHV